VGEPVFEGDDVSGNGGAVKGKFEPPALQALWEDTALRKAMFSELVG
jgi:hypothetical protein